MSKHSHHHQADALTFVGGLLTIILAAVLWRFTRNVYHTLAVEPGAWYGVLCILFIGTALAGLQKMWHGAKSALILVAISFAVLTILSSATHNPQINPLTWADKITAPASKFAEWMREDNKTGIAKTLKSLTEPKGLTSSASK